jgi:hypothetical protein
VLAWALFSGEPKSPPAVAPQASAAPVAEAPGGAKEAAPGDGPVFSAPDRAVVLASARAWSFESEPLSLSSFLPEPYAWLLDLLDERSL